MVFIAVQAISCIDRSAPKAQFLLDVFIILI